MRNRRTVFLIIGISFIVLTSLADTLYRDWSYANDIADFGLADYLPSITGTVAAVFTLLGISKDLKQKTISNAVAGVVGCVIYEIVQPFLGTGVFDWQDLVAVIFTGAVCSYVLTLGLGMSGNTQERQHSLLRQRINMKKLYRYLIAFALLIAAISSYSFGNQTGLFVFIILGFAFEAAFWFGLFPVRKRK
ncbi:hypothetical protein [Idiomarina ramblicola]|uniref:Uncharacterized protein n=1 Tax=Idiomarina ramblicola TaxID=263724 RepID=A0A432YZP5_9GAMM|nr:hypothetical protein [Idiomarina ramblicola]RUO69408.1 hypothetical protein CWI78_05695 [Idiomarina ramblicola]